MRIAIVGATGNVGTSLLRALEDEPSVEQIVAIARRPPADEATLGPRAAFHAADIARDDLTEVLRGLDAVVHLAWLIQPSRDEAKLRAVNVDGTGRVFDAIVAAGVPTLVYASSVGAYSPGPKDRRVDESWPAEGIPSLFYARHKAEVERMLNRFEQDQPAVRVVRMRPGLSFKRAAATGIRRLFLGPLLPNGLVRPEAIPVVPATPRLRFQAVHSDDVANAYRLALLTDVRGAFNVTAEPVLDARTLSELLGARPISLRPGILRTAADLSWRAHLQPSPPGWIDLAFAVPLLDSSRAARELGWTPSVSAGDALLELLDGIRKGVDHPTPPLSRAASGPLRSAELRGRAGVREVV